MRGCVRTAVAAGGTPGSGAGAPTASAAASGSPRTLLLAPGSSSAAYTAAPTAAVGGSGTAGALPPRGSIAATPRFSCASPLSRCTVHDVVLMGGDGRAGGSWCPRCLRAMSPVSVPNSRGRERLSKPQLTRARGGKSKTSRRAAPAAPARTASLRHSVGADAGARADKQAR